MGSDYSNLLSKYQYAELRIHHGSESAIRITNDEIKSSSGTFYGISARVLESNSWGFASSNNINCDVAVLLERATKLARLEKGNIKLKETKSEIKTIKNKTKETPIEEKLNSLLDAKKEISGKHVISTIISCSSFNLNKEFHNPTGSEIVQEQDYTYLSYTAITKSGELVQRGYENAASIKGFDKIDLYKIAKIADEKAERLLYAVAPPKGRFTVVLDPEMTGVFSHEALGHATEADSIIDRESILAGKLNKKIGNELVNIIDDPTAEDFGNYTYDDEGVKAEKTELVRNGILKGYLNSRETSERLNIMPNGHARADSFDAVPIVRMSNTYFMQGKASREDVFDIKHGIYLKGMKGGSVDIFSGGFMFKAEEAYEIKNGELGKLLRDVTLSGNILETLNHVELVGKDFDTSPGICGKFNQEAPVSDGGPHIRVSNMMVG
ncbi:TldD/PmbA family protein [Candidatus Micrarchaeota archaeon]|nr:TldD/PmbA family protein [Candidatus Micrarchaeota archaeon]